MKLRIHKQFTKCFSKFDSQWQGQILKTILGIKNDTGVSGLRLHKVGEYYSYSVNMDVRILSILTYDEILLIYVGHHEETYRWAERNTPVYSNKDIVGFFDGKEEIKAEKFIIVNDKYQYLKDYGFDEGFINYISGMNEDQLLDAIGYIAPEYQELILFGPGSANKTDIAGCSNAIVITDDKQLEDALKLSVYDWSLFLHPRQRYVLDYPLWKNVMIKGGPGTGKTVALIHRFVKCYKTSKAKKPVFLCCNDCTKAIIVRMLSRLSVKAESNVVVFDDFKQDASGRKLTEFLQQYEHIFIDEAQDMPIYLASRILYLLENESEIPPFTMALDLNQSLFSSIGEAIKRLEKYCDIILLDYCYRSTTQILDKATSVLDNGIKNSSAKNFQEQHAIEMSNDSATKNIKCALSGPAVEESACCDVGCLCAKIKDYIKSEQLKINDNEWAIICSEENNKWLVDILPEFKSNIYSSYEVKGQEFFTGIVVHKDEADDIIKTAKGFKKHVLTDYVSVSRFREKLFYIDFMGWNNGGNNK